MVVVGGVQQGDMLAWRRVQDGHGVGPLDKTLSTPPFIFPSRIPNKEKKSKNR